MDVERTTNSFEEPDQSVSSLPAVTQPPRPEDYLDGLVDSHKMTEAQKLELLIILFNCMKGFVDLGYGLTPVQNLIESFEKSAHEDMILVKCEYDQHDQV